MHRRYARDGCASESDHGLAAWKMDLPSPKKYIHLALTNGWDALSREGVEENKCTCYLDPAHRLTAF
jgi:hypothetical protein